MSYYGAKTFNSLFSVHKQRLVANGSYRFGGAHAQVAYNANDNTEVPVTLHHSGVNVIEAGADDVVSITLLGVKSDIPATFSNIAFEEVSGSTTLPANTYGVVLEGLFNVGSNTLDAEIDLHLIEPESIVSGTGKLIKFTIEQA